MMDDENIYPMPAVRLQVSHPEPHRDVFLTAYRAADDAPDRDRFALIVNNLNKAPRRISIELTGFPDRQLTPHRTSPEENLEPLDPNTIQDSTLEATLPARSITTFIPTTPPAP
jgi:hypothetical protein